MISKISIIPALHPTLQVSEMVAFSDLQVAGGDLLEGPGRLCCCCSFCLYLVGRDKTAAQHSCHMLQVRGFKGTLLGIGSKVWRDVSSWTSCRASLGWFVSCFLMCFGVLFWAGGQKTTGLQIFDSRGGRDNNIF